MSEIHYGRGYVYSIQYHLVWCVKYRHDVLYGHVDIDVKQLLKQIADDNNVKIMEMESVKDHIYLLIECTPQHYIPWNGNSFFDKFYKVQNFFPYAIPIVL
ncbi:IS200/IS605 family transposase, partial [Enterococcus faecium]|nr:IS200/IS605 family transposase [Enterococcus faecium]MDQ8245535.1 IS200/IS605 family transposase [Enterococcus faecium]